MQKNSEKLRLWKDRLADSEAAYQAELDKMDGREEQYLGRRKLRPVTDRDRDVNGQSFQTPHVRNITAELIEAQVSSAIPQPKVTARRREDEGLAKLIEDMLRNELDRMPMELVNDIQERTVPLQGGGWYHLEWDNRARTHTTTGEVTITARHPKQVIPQAGVYTGTEDMDYILLKLPTTKEAVKSRYGVDLSEESEEDPELRGSGGQIQAEDMVTQIIAYYRNGKGGIGKFSWVRDTVLEDLEDYQARRLRRCAQCGRVEPMEGDVIVDRQTMVLPGTMAALLGAVPETVEETHIWHDGDPCPDCGGTRWEERQEDYVVSRDSRGQPVYDQFDRYDFLERDENGDWYWNDQFLFSTDTSAPLANNREQLWQETISLFSAGCFGVPTELDTLVALWTKLELLHYPGAAETRRYLEEKLERQAAAQAQAAQAQQAAMGPPGGGEAAVASQVEDRAREDAMAAVFGGGQPAGH